LALAIFIMSLAAIGLLINIGSDHGTEARLHSTGARLAQSKLAEIEAGVVALTEPGGSFDGADASWQWTLTAEPYSPTLYFVTVTVTRDINGRTFELSVSQYLLDPAIKGSATELKRPTGETTEGMPCHASRVGSGQWAAGRENRPTARVRFLPTAHCPLPAAARVSPFWNCCWRW